MDDAIALLNRHFPTVLAEHVGATLVADSAPRPEISNLEYISSTSTEPAHLLLNLRILAFSEACRTIPLDYPPKPVSPDAMVTSPAFEEPEETPEYLEQQLALLTQAQKLYAFSKTLLDANDRATYLKELENVGGLLAYKVPEKSPMAKYMTMERREAVADQINRAILSESLSLSSVLDSFLSTERTGRPLVSALELITRYTSTLWQSAHQQGVKARPGASIVPPRSGKASPSLDADSEVRIYLHTRIIDDLLLTDLLVIDRSYQPLICNSSSMQSHDQVIVFATLLGCICQ